MRVETWHTFHPLEEQRFHRAIDADFDDFGTPADVLEFETAVPALAREHHGEVRLHHIDTIDAYAKLVEDIRLSLHNTKE
ncbi:hypothetical protein [Xanthomonas hortorum]|uniref:Uncharacterized protein n=1 Tax=Xanthomonas hortorum pv. hederae TaxID=453603 RepID=A0A9X4H9X3_9XANT|nr:hypothetical protein [Xanthomonas hortorum]MDC8640408.1 hypothetical protein [Xanthomonas hortorum pv. hederae]